jgi:FkbM family methyltransferase
MFLTSIKMQFWRAILKIRDSSLRMPNDTSQSLEATKLFSILSSYPVKYIVDVGANDGFNLSNSSFFVANGWSALLVEPVPNSILAARKFHLLNSNVKFEQVAISNKQGSVKLFLDKVGDQNLFATIETYASPLHQKYVGKEFINVRTETLDMILQKHNVPINFAILSIDVEGHEAEVLEKLGNFRPAVILVERNLQSFTKSLLKQKILTDQKYIYAARIGCNEVYIDSTSQFINLHVKNFEELSSIGI